MAIRQGFNEAWCYDVLREVRWPNGITCPFCGWGRVTTHAKSVGTPRRRYFCLGCWRTFTDLTGTLFAHTNLPLGTWVRGLQLLGRGRTTSQLAKEVGVKWDTAAHMERRLGAALRHPGLVPQLREALRKNERG